jgi:hypothetical protein
MSEDSQRDVGDEVIDQYIAELNKTKSDPEKKRQFMEQFAKRSSQKPPENNASEDDPLMHASVSNPSRMHEESNDDGIGLVTSEEKRRDAEETDDEEDEPKPSRRVIPRGDYKPQEAQASDDAPSDSNESIVKRLEKAGIQFPEELDRDALDDAQRLAAVLLDNKIKGTKYIIENYVKKSYSTSRRAAERLNDLMKDVAIPERTRRIVLTTYYDSLSKKALDNIFFEEEDEDDENSPSQRRSKDNDQIVRIALKDPKGKLILDADGRPIIKEVTKGDLYYALQATQMGGGGGNSADFLETALKLQDKRFEDNARYNHEQIEFWKRMSSGDPVQRLVQQKEDLVKLGIVSSDIEKPSDYQTKVIKEAREAGKEIFNETKSEIKSLVELFRDDIIKPALTDRRNKTGDNSGPRDIDDFKDSKDQEDAFHILNEAISHEQPQSKDKMEKSE